MQHSVQTRRALRQADKWASEAEMLWRYGYRMSCSTCDCCERIWWAVSTAVCGAIVNTNNTALSTRDRICASKARVL